MSPQRLSAQRALDFYRDLLLIRRFEERAARFVTEGKVSSTHSAVGQEAVAVGVCGALQPQDQILSTHRGHHHCLAKGLQPQRLMAELLGRDNGVNGGRAGSMHVMDPELGILGANAIVGASIPIAVGAAYAAQVSGSGRVVVSFFGEGASSQGGCHEAMNLAALWRLPVLFVCENNVYAEHSHVSVHASVANLADRAAGYGFPGVVADGNDVEAVHAAAQTAVDRARSGQGPSLLECKTFRVRGHFEGDPQKYKDPEEAGRWLARDPLQRWKSRLLESFDVRAAQLEAIAAQVEETVVAAAAFAEAGSLPDPAALAAHVYVGEAA